MNAIQAASAVYILGLVAFGLYIVARAVFTEKDWNGKLNGTLFYALVVAAVVCAITTLGAL